MSVFELGPGFRFVDVPGVGTEPPMGVWHVHLEPGERVVSVETVKDAFGYARARVWLVSGEAPVDAG